MVNFNSQFRWRNFLGLHRLDSFKSICIAAHWPLPLTAGAATSKLFFLYIHSELHLHSLYRILKKKIKINSTFFLYKTFIQTKSSSILRDVSARQEDSEKKDGLSHAIFLFHSISGTQTRVKIVLQTVWGDPDSGEITANYLFICHSD